MTGAELAILGPALGPLAGLIIEITKKGGGNLVKAFKDIGRAREAAQKYINQYQTYHGTLKVLGMPRGLSLDDVYVAVQFLNESSRRKFESVAALQEAYRQKGARSFQLAERGKKNVIAVANDRQYLAVLADPGAGKTTFLRKVGLEALKGELGDYQHSCLPVFLDLKKVFKNDKNESHLQKSVSEEFERAGFPHPEEFATEALEQGKLLILLDGLDEVPSKLMSSASDEIEDFVRRYGSNRFIASCRLAAYRSSFRSFVDVELAEFDDRQIKQFIESWFQSDLDEEMGVAAKCWQELQQEGNEAAKELARSPLLLTFLCIAYNKTQSFPPNRSRLYNSALDILLEEWSAEKRVERHEIFRQLNIDLEKILLSEIAWQGFSQDSLFYSQHFLVERIKEFLADSVERPKYLNGQAILDAICIEQGILAERAESVFSFSHLTLQEYLTAHYIAQEQSRIEDLVADRLCEKRWREVFLLLAGILENGEKLLLLMARETRRLASAPKLQILLHWANQVTSGSEANYHSAAKRAIAISLALDLALDRNIDRNLIFALDLPRALDLALDLALARFRDLLLDLIPYRALYLDRDLEFARQLEKINIFEHLDFKILIARLYALKAKTSDSDRAISEDELLQRRRQIWLDVLQLDPEWLRFSRKEAELVGKYLYANRLIVACQESALRVSRKAWDAIKERMLGGDMV